MNGRINRVKEALARTVSKLAEDIKASHAAGKLPADYSLGFANGVIFCNHHIQGMGGEPVFFNRTTSIGALPKPVTLQSGDPVRDSFSYQMMQDDVLVKLRALLSEVGFDDKGRSFEMTEKAVVALAAVGKAVHTMDGFEQDQKLIQKAKKANE